MLRRPNILIKLVAITLVMAFSLENILWANPEIDKRRSPSANTLQVPSLFRLDENRLKISLAIVLRKIPDVRNFSLPIALDVGGIWVEMDFAGPEKRESEDGKTVIVPCTFAAQKCDAVIDPDTKDILELIWPGEKQKPAAAAIAETPEHAWLRVAEEKTGSVAEKPVEKPLITKKLLLTLARMFRHRREIPAVLLIGFICASLGFPYFWFIAGVFFDITTFIVLYVYQRPPPSPALIGVSGAQSGMFETSPSPADNIPEAIPVHFANEKPAGRRTGGAPSSPRFLVEVEIQRLSTEQMCIIARLQAIFKGLFYPAFLG